LLYDLLKMCVSIFFNILNILLGGRLPPFGSAAMIVERDGRYLVVRLPRGHIVFPGGFMAWREDPKQAAEREGYEETGFRLQADELIHFYSDISSSWLHMSTLSFVFCGHIVSGKLRKSAEGQPCWMSEEELRKRMDKHTLRALDDYLTYRKKKLDPSVV